MDNITHTAGLLEMQAIYCREAGEGGRLIAVTMPDGGSIVQTANMRRLVAAWNACDGIDTERLETGGAGYVSRIYAQATKADDNTIRTEAAKLIERLSTMAVHPSHYAELRAALEGDAQPATPAEAFAQLQIVPAAPELGTEDDDTGAPIVRPLHMRAPGHGCAYWFEPSAPGARPFLMAAPLDNVTGAVLWNDECEVDPQGRADYPAILAKLVEANDDATKYERAALAYGAVFFKSSEPGQIICAMPNGESESGATREEAARIICERHNLTR